MAVTTQYSGGAGSVTSSNAALSTKSPQTQLEYLTEHLERSTKRVFVIHEELNRFFQTTFGSCTDMSDKMDKADGAPTSTSTLQLLMEAENTLSNALDILEADMQFFKEQNL